MAGYYDSDAPVSDNREIIGYQWVGGDSGDYQPIYAPASSPASVAASAPAFAPTPSPAPSPLQMAAQSEAASTPAPAPFIPLFGAAPPPPSTFAPAVMTPQEQAEEFIDWRLAQRPDPFTQPQMAGFATIGDYYKATGQDPYSAAEQKFAQESVARWNPIGDIRQQSGIGADNPWEDPNWETEVALQRAATEAQRVANANASQPFTAGPGPVAQPQNLTLDPTYAAILGGADPTTVLRAVNIMTYGPGAYKQSGMDPAALALANRLENYDLPQSTLDKLFPSYAPPPPAPSAPLSAAAATKTATNTGAGLTTSSLVQDFQNQYQSIVNSPTSSAKDIINFVNSSLENKQISALFGDKLKELQKSDQFKEIQRLAGVGNVKDYEGNEYNPLTLIKLAGQIGKNIDTANLSGSVFKTAGESIGFDYGEGAKVFGKDPNASQQVLLDMARYLMKSGVTDLSQLTAKEYQVPESVISGESGDSVIPGYTTKGVFAGDKRIDDRFGQTYTGKGGTGYNVTIDPATGKPKFSTTGFTTGESEMIAPLLAIGSMAIAPWLTGQISGLLPGAAAAGSAASAGNLLASQALAGGALSGTTSALLGGDFGKGFIRGALPPVVGAGVNQFIPADFAAANPNIANAIRGVGTNVITAGLTGQDVSTALTNSVINNTLSATLNMVPGYSDLPAAGKALVSQAVSAAVRGGNIDPMNAAMSVIAAQMAADRKSAPGKAQGGLAMASGGAVRRYEDGGAVDFGNFFDSGDFSFDAGDFDIGSLDFGNLDLGNLTFDASDFDLGNLDIGGAGQTQVPRDLLLASLDNDLGGFRVDVSGVPTFAESPNADRVPLNWNERLLSAEEFSSNNLPPGTGYDPARNAWITKSDALVDIENIASQGFGYGTTAGGISSGDFSRADREAYNQQVYQSVIDELMGTPSREFGAYSGANVPSDEEFNQRLIEDIGADLGSVPVTGRRESLVEDDLQSFIDYGPGREDFGDVTFESVPVTGRRELTQDDYYDYPNPRIVDDYYDYPNPRIVDDYYDYPNPRIIPAGELKPVTITASRDRGVSTDLPSPLVVPKDVDDDRTKPPTPPVTPPRPPTQPPRPPVSPPPAQRPAVSIPAPPAINIPAVQQLAPLVLQALRTEGGGKFQDPLERLKAAVTGTRSSAAEMFKMDPYLESILRQRQEPGYYNYGREPSLEEVLNRREMAEGGAVPAYAQGGLAAPLMAAAGGKSYVDGREDFRDGKHVAGPGDGQSDDIPAMLADGEFVFPADVVAALGNGSTKAGTDKLYEMMHNIRSYHRSAKPEDLPPPAKKSPLDYLSKKKQGAKK